MVDLTDTTDIRERVRAKYAAAATAASAASAEAGCSGTGSVTCGPADAEGVFAQPPRQISPRARPSLTSVPALAPTS